MVEVTFHNYEYDLVSHKHVYTHVLQSLRSKGRRRVEGQLYSTLFEVASTPRAPTAEMIHSVLAAHPSYVCKTCHSALTKYENIKQQIKKITSYQYSLFLYSSESQTVSIGINSITKAHTCAQYLGLNTFQDVSGDIHITIEPSEPRR